MSRHCIAIMVTEVSHNQQPPWKGPACVPVGFCVGGHSKGRSGRGLAPGISGLHILGICPGSISSFYGYAVQADRDPLSDQELQQEKGSPSPHLIRQLQPYPVTLPCQESHLPSCVLESPWGW